MSLLAVGLSHRSAPMAVLEEAAVDAAGVEALAQALAACENVREVLVLGTCNRLEVYAECGTFHGALAEIGQCLVAATGIERERLTEHLYVHYEERAIAHLFTVACGLDSMALGEGQILGQLRTSLRRAQRAGRAGPVLNALVQQALRVAKRAHTETGLDRAGLSLVETALGAAADHVGPLTGACVLVLGAGSMSSLAATTIARSGCRDLVIVNRTYERAVLLAEATAGRAVRVTRMAQALTEADVVVSCTGAVGYVVSADQVGEAAAARQHRPQVYLDLALPRTCNPARARPPGSPCSGSPNSATCWPVGTGTPPPTSWGPRGTSSRPRSRPTWRTAAPCRSRRPWPRCAAAPSRCWRPNSTGWRHACPTSPSGSRPRSASPCTASSRSCCTPRPCA